MKTANRYKINAILLFFLFVVSNCSSIEYPLVDQLQITNKQFVKACNVIVENANRINREKQYDKNNLINSFVVRVGKVDNDTCYQFIFGNISSIKEAIYDEFQTYGYFYYRHCVFLVQCESKTVDQDLFRKTGEKNRISFVFHYRKSLFSRLFKNKREIFVMDNYSPISHSFCYKNGKLVYINN